MWVVRVGYSQVVIFYTISNHQNWIVREERDFVKEISRVRKEGEQVLNF
jgi:hypothetical protein